MFNDEEPVPFKKMNDFSTVDGFVEISEDLADMIKFVANEPSVGLFYIQQHTQNAAPNVINLKNNVVEKSHETTLHTEDLEDSITMVRSMKECGLPIADEMIGEIKRSLSVISSTQPKRGLIYNSRTGFLGRTSSWSPATWGRNAVHSRQDNDKSTGYLSSVLKSAKQTANSFKWPEVEPREAYQSKGENVSSDHAPPFLSAIGGPTPPTPEAETEDLPLSSEVGRELQEESQLSKSMSHQQFFSLYENYDEFKADQEAKLEEWLGETGNDKDRAGKNIAR
ncbi:uncharacterized protein LOC105174188 [Sesamum indicum]|uniref:Uncharacterized protein LOC105174188 n=1 Tax=Sesamum indicum TaxID=4182 RepID=A0A6I9U9Z8_SESIN|nr:uncharacterized protein LOC105174188 [Sesamum indicum]